MKKRMQDAAWLVLGFIVCWMLYSGVAWAIDQTPLSVRQLLSLQSATASGTPAYNQGVLVSGVVTITGAPTPLATVTVVVSGTPNVAVVNTPTVIVSGYATPIPTQPVVGTLTDNGAAPSTNNVGALPAHASASAPSSTEGRLVSLWVSLGGLLHTAWDQTLDKTNDSIAVGWRSRTYLTFTAPAFTSVGSDTIVTFTQNAAGTTTGSVTSYVVTNGKSFHLQSLSISTRSTSTTVAQETTWTLRHNTAGACTTSSAAVGSWDLQGSPVASAVNGGGDHVVVNLGDYGLPFVGDGTGAICLTANSSSTNGKDSATLIGYEATDP